MANANIPDWVPVVFPIVFSGGLIGITTFLVKQITDRKDATISEKDATISNLREQVANLDKLNQREIQASKANYESRIGSLQRENERLEEELREVTRFQNLLESNLAELRKQGVTGETDPHIREILKCLKQLSSYEITEANCRTAARWVRNKRDSWLKTLTDYAIGKYFEELKNKQDDFTHNVSECLEWLYDSVYHNVPHHFSDYLPQISADAAFPYRGCFNYLKQLDDIGDLTHAEAEIFYQYLDSLIRFLQDKSAS